MNKARVVTLAFAFVSLCDGSRMTASPVGDFLTKGFHYEFRFGRSPTNSAKAQTRSPIWGLAPLYQRPEEPQPELPPCTFSIDPRWSQWITNAVFLIDAAYDAQLKGDFIERQ